MKFEEILKKASLGDEEARVYLLNLYKPLLVKTSVNDKAFDEDLYQEQQMCLIRCILKFVSNHEI